MKGGREEEGEEDRRGERREKMGRGRDKGKEGGGEKEIGKERGKGKEGRPYFSLF